MTAAAARGQAQFTVALSFSWSCCCCCSALLFVSSSTTRQINLATSLDVHLVSRRPLFPSSSTRVLLLHLPSKSYLITPLSRTLLSYSSRCSPVSEISTRRTWRNIFPFRVFVPSSDEPNRLLFRRSVLLTLSSLENPFSVY